LKLSPKTLLKQLKHPHTPNFPSTLENIRIVDPKSE
jgi:hypothetical protein